MPIPAVRISPSILSTIGIELIELETFIAVARTESFSAAAVSMHVSQPTVTGRIQRIESVLGVSLLRRTTRKVELTPDGALLLVEATKALEGLINVVEGFRARSRLTRQRVVVAATPTLASLTLPQIIHGYRQLFPDVEIELRDLQYAGVLAAIYDGSAHLGVLAYDGTDPHYRFEALWTDDMLMMAPPTHPLSHAKSVEIEDFAKHPLIMVDQHQALRSRIMDALAERGLTLPPCQIVSNLNTLLGMLNAGMGVALLPRSMSTRTAIAPNILIEIDGIDLRRHFGIVRLKRAVASVAEQSFCRYFQDAIPPSLKRDAKP